MMSPTLLAKPVIIIGAGRSGTNMLRDVLTRLDGVDTWPCDEINYIWRHGNRDEPTDELTPAHATPDVVDFIRCQFSRMVNSSSLVRFPAEERFLVEKTCANSLRVSFVDTVFPEARYIFLVRDGRDVVASARRRWKAPIDVRYLMAKARFVPLGDLPYYSSRYLLNRLSKHRNSEKSLAAWGPKFQGMDQLSASKSLDHVCAAQWTRCVQSSSDAFEAMSSDKVLTVHYEQFVTQPLEVLQHITEFIGAKHDIETLQQACSEVREESVGKGKDEFHDEKGELMKIMHATLARQGYE